MIPKTIHYCWFGRGEKPALARRCIASWRAFCPDYEIVEWNEDNFDVTQNGYTRWCYENRKFAFLSDYVRLAVVAEHGGLYFDTDVELLRSPGWITLAALAVLLLVIAGAALLGRWIVRRQRRRHRGW